MKVWRAIPKGAQIALLTVAVLAVVLMVLWVASPLWTSHAHR